MDNNWEVIPPRFHYFRPAVEACGETRIVPFDHALNRHVPFVERITPEQLHSLTSLHAEIIQRDDALAIAAWCESMEGGTQAEKDAAGRIRGILSIIDQLAENEITPFCDAPLEKSDPKPCDEPPELQLPHELEYLIGPALHFGERYQSELQMSRFLAEASPEEQDQLSALAELVRQNKDWPKVLQWLRDVAAKNVRYGWDIDRLFNLMDLCDFEFESDQKNRALYDSQQLLAGLTNMSTFEQIIVIASITILVISVLVVFVMSLFGTDLVIFDRYRTASPKHYRNLKQVCRVNGLMVAAMSICGIVLAPFVAFGPEGSWLLAGFGMAASGIFLWLSIRWFRWSLKP